MGVQLKLSNYNFFVIGQLQLETLCSYEVHSNGFFVCYFPPHAEDIFLSEIGQTYKLNFLGFYRMSLKLGEGTDLNISNNFCDSDFFVFYGLVRK